MALITVLQSDTFEGWRVKTNQVSQLQGDLTQLNSAISGASIVEAINNTHIKATGTSIALAIALG